MVVFSHLHLPAFLVHLGHLAPSTIPMLDGNAGVQAFFVLSGFLITLLLVQERQRAGAISLKHFYIRRTLRIVPLYTLFLLVLTAIHAAGVYVTTWPSLGYAYFYIFNFVPVKWYTSILGHTWTLAVEEHFYLLWPPILAAALLSRRRFLLSGLAAFIVLSFVLLQVLLGFTHLDEIFHVRKWTFIAGSNIAFGCLAALMLTEGRHVATWSRLLGHPLALLAAAALYANSTYLDAGWRDVGSYLRAAGLMLLIAWIHLNQRSIVARVLELAPLRYIGKISYGIYIWQGFFLSTGAYRAVGQGWPPPDPALGLLLLVVVAPLSYHFFEKPFLRLKTRFSTHDLGDADARDLDGRRAAPAIGRRQPG